MAKSNASSHKLYFIESSQSKLVCELTSFTFGGSRDIIDFTTKDNSGYRDFIPGLGSNTLNIEGMVDYQPDANSRNLDDIVSAWMNKTLIVVKITNNVSGDTVYTGNAYVTTFEETSPTEAALTFTATLELKGTIVVGTNS